MRFGYWMTCGYTILIRTRGWNCRFINRRSSTVLPSLRFNTSKGYIFSGGWCLTIKFLGIFPVSSSINSPLETVNLSASQPPARCVTRENIRCCFSRYLFLRRWLTKLLIISSFLLLPSGCWLIMAWIMGLLSLVFRWNKKRIRRGDTIWLKIMRNCFGIGRSSCPLWTTSKPASMSLFRLIKGLNLIYLRKIRGASMATILKLPL